MTINVHVMTHHIGSIAFGFCALLLFFSLAVQMALPAANVCSCCGGDLISKLWQQPQAWVVSGQCKHSGREDETTVYVCGPCLHFLWRDHDRDLHNASLHDWGLWDTKHKTFKSALQNMFLRKMPLIGDDDEQPFTLTIFSRTWY